MVPIDPDENRRALYVLALHVVRAFIAGVVVLFFLSNFVSVSHAQVVYTEVADPDYYARLGRQSAYPLYKDDLAVGKLPAWAQIGTPSFSGDSITQIPVKYGWKLQYVHSDMNGDGAEGDEFIAMQEYASASQVINYAESLIGTPWEGATCGALLDAGFVEPCQIPPLELPDVEAAPNPTLTSCKRGYQTPHTSNAQISTGGLLSDCIVDGVAYWVSQLTPSTTFPNVRLARTTCTGTTTKVMTYYIRWGTSQGNFRLVAMPCGAVRLRVLTCMSRTL